jgi:hypothetical protein
MTVMPNTFETLNGFLARFSNEVEGRESSRPTPETAAKLQSFARGRMPAPELPEFIRQLNEQPEWVAMLATEVKAIRNSSGNKE